MRKALERCSSTIRVRVLSTDESLRNRDTDHGYERDTENVLVPRAQPDLHGFCLVFKLIHSLESPP